MTAEDAEFGPSRYSAVFPHWVELYESTVCFSIPYLHLHTYKYMFHDSLTEFKSQGLIFLVLLI
jgi:hypothetical protein